MVVIIINKEKFPKNFMGGGAHYRYFNDLKNAEAAAKGLRSIGWNVIIVRNKGKYKLYLK